MEQASNLAKTALTSSKQKSSEQPQRQLPREVNELVLYVFSRFQASYREAWTSQFKAPNEATAKRRMDLIKAEWGQTLMGVAGLDRLLVDDAVELCKKEYPEFPPKPGGFLLACHRAREIMRFNERESSRVYLPALPKLKNPEAHRVGVEALYGVLGKKKQANREAGQKA